MYRGVKLAEFRTLLGGGVRIGLLSETEVSVDAISLSRKFCPGCRFNFLLHYIHQPLNPEISQEEKDLIDKFLDGNEEGDRNGTV